MIKTLKIKLSKNKKDIFPLYLLLIIASLGFVSFYGYRGIYPIDSFLIFNGGYNILNGYHPFKDYWTISGPILDYAQAFFFLIFGVNWLSYVLHAFLINSIISLSVFHLFLRLNIDKFYSFLYSLSLAILAYPQTGTPFMDHHAFYFSFLSIIFLSLALIDQKKIYWSFVPICLFVSFFSKQLPSSYLLLLILLFLVFFFLNNKKHRKIAFDWLLIGTGICSLSLLILILFTQIPLKNFLIQYLYYPYTLGNLRIDQINFNFHNVIFQYKFLYISFFVIMIYLFQLIQKRNPKNNLDFSIIILNLSLLVVFVFSQIITKNQILIFFLIPYFLGISQFLISKLNINKKFNFLILIFLIFITIKYHDRFNNHKKFMELADADFSKAQNAKILDKKLSSLKWINNQYINDPKYELSMLIKNKNYLENNTSNYILITDYQIFPSILKLKTVSPLKWYDNLSIPSKESIFYNKYKDFFKKSITNQKIEYIFLLGKKNWIIKDLFSEEKCLKLIKINDIMFKGDIRSCY